MVNTKNEGLIIVHNETYSTKSGINQIPQKALLHVSREAPVYMYESILDGFQPNGRENLTRLRFQRPVFSKEELLASSSKY